MLVTARPAEKSLSGMTDKDPHKLVDSWMVCDKCGATWGHGEEHPFYKPHPRNGCENVGATAWDDQYFSRGIHQEYQYNDQHNQDLQV